MFSSKLLLIGVCTIVINFTMAKDYYVTTDAKRNFFDAFQHCEACGRQLATVNSAEEESDLEEAIRASSVPGNNLWLSGTKIFNPALGSYVWMSTGVPVTYSNWEVNQPDNFNGNENCMHVLSTTTNGRTYAWNDIDCYTLMYYVCEDRICKNNPNCNNCDDHI